jgi:hypothetical protein
MTRIVTEFKKDEARELALLAIKTMGDGKGFSLDVDGTTRGYVQFESNKKRDVHPDAIPGYVKLKLRGDDIQVDPVDLRDALCEGFRALAKEALEEPERKNIGWLEKRRYRNDINVGGRGVRDIRQISYGGRDHIQMPLAVRTGLLSYAKQKAEQHFRAG